MSAAFDPAKINSILTEVGSYLMELSQDPGQRQAVKKPDGSPVTPTDQKLSDLLYERLSPMAPVICEERPPHHQLSEPHFLVDPLDGTQYYAKGEREFAICVAFMSEGKPMYGGIFDPNQGELFWGQAGKGAYVGQNRLRPLSEPSEDTLSLFSSGFHRKPEAAPLVKALRPQSIQEKGSALKFCDMAQGHVDLYIRFGLTQEWDTAAAQVILGEVGLEIWEMKTLAPLQYGKPGFLNRGLLAGHRLALPNVAQILKNHQAQLKGRS